MSAVLTEAGNSAQEGQEANSIPVGVGGRDPALYLNAHDLARLGITPREVLDAVTDVLDDIANGNAAQGPKSSVEAGAGAYVQALPSVLQTDGIACVKWVSILPVEAGPGIQATLLLTSLQSGRLLAVLDGAWITAVRTAAMSAIAARALAKPNSKSVGFVGCGVQAESHLHMLLQVLPGLRFVAAYARSRQGAERFCVHARSFGLHAAAVVSPREAVIGHDVVVSSVPASGMSEPFLDASWLDDGAFAALVDLGRSWVANSIHAAEVVATDDRTQSALLAAAGKLSHPGPYAFSLDELARGRPEGLGAGGRRVFIFGGAGACDAAVAKLCHQRALAQGDVGTPLPHSPAGGD